MGYLIKKKEVLNDTVIKMDIVAPNVARKAKPGQFIILRVDEEGERIPLTIYKTTNDLVSIIFQVVGLTTMKLNVKNEGDELATFVGPLGRPSELAGYKKALVIGGGVGSAIAYPIAKGFKDSGANVDVILGFRSKDLVILEDDFKKTIDNLYLYTDDGSYQNKGFVTDGLKMLIENGHNYDICFVVGPLIMMKNVSLLTKEYNIKTIVSMNPLMIDGTGMCGCCRLTVDGKMKFACIDGPDFDGHLVDYDEAMSRNQMYKEEEKKARSEHCNLYRGTSDGK
ncbi:MAG: sulfide/dihydroorotate dehydrogenase-like FAD/NAD-binding protein [Bacilli bacterium]|nr:sulfide/dihydroorotate dehydrogenase-like FAD/NAD-binding protein [Bacilli bacterium]